MTNNIFTDMCSLLTVHFRNSVTDPVTGRGNDYTDSFSGNGVQTSFQTTHKAVSNVKSVEVDGVEVFNVKNYNVSYGWSTAYSQIIFVRPPANESVITVDYHCGQHFVFPGWVSANLNPSMPRIGFSQMPGDRETVGIGEYSEGAIKVSTPETFSSTGQKNFTFTHTNEGIDSVLYLNATPLFAPADFTVDETSIIFREAIPAGIDVLCVTHKINQDKGFRRAVRYTLKYQVDVWAQNPKFRDDLASEMNEAISKPENRRKLRRMGFLDIIVTETPQDLDVDTSATKYSNLFRKTFEFQATIETYYDELWYKIQEVVINPITVQS